MPTALLEPYLSGLSPGRKALCNDRYQRWLQALARDNLAVTLDDKLMHALVKAWNASDFVAETCMAQPNLLIGLTQSQDLTQAYVAAAYRDKLGALSFADDVDLGKQLRRFRRREMLRIAWRDLSGWADLAETMHELSWLAEACIQCALEFLYRQACALRATPVLQDGSPQQIVVLGMGKLGGHELNFSSDIDLIFAYPEDGVLPDRKATSYGEFFTRLCQKLVRVLDDVTEDGFVFRTDIRLRPFGDSGPVLMTFDGMEQYYLTQAREWERYAMIKARQVAGDRNAGAQLMAMLQPFVYRRYLDYGAIEELRGLKLQIAQELKRKDRLDNIKLGPGGIREIEFIGQVFQLIRGGKDKALQTRSIQQALQAAEQLDLLSHATYAKLIEAYRFLRRAENRIQAYRDEQCHDLPKTEAAQLALANAMDYDNWEEFKTALDVQRTQVQAVFDQIFASQRQDKLAQPGVQIWAATAEPQPLCAALTDLGYRRPEQTLQIILDFKQSLAYRRMTAKGAGVIDKLIPQLLELATSLANPDECVRRLVQLFEKVAGRNVYLALLAENPDALGQLIKLAAASEWLCDYLALYPALFDELLDTRRLYEPLKRDKLSAQLAIIVEGIELDDIEQFMSALRQFKHLNVLRIAAADIMAVIPLMVVSDYLTFLAEAIVAHVVERAWLMISSKHGNPPGSDAAHCQFAVIGFGKLGGIELGYGSDLDLVFLCAYADGNALTDGASPISAAQFYGRLGLKVRHILDTKLLSGVLYEVDMRLRPNGDSGLLVTHVDAYEAYQRNNAWVWEHQALVRGRFIAGDVALKPRFEAIRHNILSLSRDKLAIQAEVREMREKMRTALDTTASHQFDLKQSKGGIADIEFIVQFLVLAHAAQYPDLTTYTDNIRQLEALARHGILVPKEADKLKQAFCRYRDLGHKLVLQGDQCVIDAAEISGLKSDIEGLWHKLMLTDNITTATTLGDDNNGNGR